MSQNITGLLQDGAVAKNSLTKDLRYVLGRGSFFLVNTLASQLMQKIHLPLDKYLIEVTVLTISRLYLSSSY